LPPSQVVPALADKGIYIASESTMYRILRIEKMQNHRGYSKPSEKRRYPQTHVAKAPNQVWTWDITWLPTMVVGMYYKLYMIVDIFSRKIVGWEVWTEETGELASDLVEKAIMNEKIRGNPLVLHSDINRLKILKYTTGISNIKFYTTTFLTNIEYKMIKKRLKQGKFQNALKGHWSNGNPPLPYVYNKETRSLTIDDTMKRTYRYIIDSVVIDKKPTNQIAHELNGKEWLTAGRKGNKYWTSKTVRDILIDKVHLDYKKSGFGHIVIGKTKGNAHTIKSSTALKFKRIEEKDWFLFKGLHKAVKTEEEHEAIELFLSRKTKAPNKTTAKKIYPLTGLIKCSYCGHFLGFTERSDRNCWYVDPFGNKCGNKSSSVQQLIEKIHESIEKHIKDVKQEIDTVDTSRLSGIDEQFKVNKKFLAANDIAFEQVDKVYRAEVYTID